MQGTPESGFHGEMTTLLPSFSDALDSYLVPRRHLEQASFVLAKPTAHPERRMLAKQRKPGAKQALQRFEMSVRWQFAMKSAFSRR
jgi:hypothetical protein